MTTAGKTFVPRTRVSIAGQQWQINGDVLHPGSPAEGLLTNVRMVNAVFEDTGPAVARLPQDFDPQVNTQRFIQQIPNYVNHGVTAFTISLQGGHPGYEGAVNSAFDADGSLRDSYMHRVSQVIEACDQHAAIVILSCFYQRQHGHGRALAGRQAIRQAVVNIARWIEQHHFTNVVLEISNEYMHNGYNLWQDGQWMCSDEGQIELIRLARQTVPTLLVSTSGMGDGRMSEIIASEVDFLLIHFNNTAMQDIPQRSAEAARFGKPVVCSEDNKTGPVGAEAARLSILHGVGWGFMHIKKNQNAPFEFDGEADDPDVYRMLRMLTTAGALAQRGSEAMASILITQPKDGDIFREGDTIVVHTAVTAGGDQPVAAIEVHSNNQRIGTATTDPWQIRWENASAGKFDLVAIQVDRSGREIARSHPVDIIIQPRR